MSENRLYVAYDLGHPEGIRVAVNDYEPLLVIVPRPDGLPTVVFLRL